MPSHVRERTNVSCGHFTIEGEEFQGILDMLTEWKNGPEGRQFLSLCAVRAGRAERGGPRVIIYFTFDLISVDTKREQKLFVHRHTDIMRRRFGNGLVAWSVSSPVHIVD